MPKPKQIKWGETKQNPSHNKSLSPEIRVADFLGKYTILLNGTTCEKRAKQPQELDIEYKKEIIDFISQTINDILDRVELEEFNPIDRSRNLYYEDRIRGYNHAVKKLKAKIKAIKEGFEG